MTTEHINPTNICERCSAMYGLHQEWCAEANSTVVLTDDGLAEIAGAIRRSSPATG